MIHYVAGKTLAQTNARCKVVIVQEGFSFADIPQDIAAQAPSLQTIIKEEQFIGKSMTTLSVPLVEKEQVAFLVLIGIGKAEVKSPFLLKNIAELLVNLFAWQRLIIGDQWPFNCPTRAFLGLMMNILPNRVPPLRQWQCIPSIPILPILIANEK